MQVSAGGTPPILLERAHVHQKQANSLHHYGKYQLCVKFLHAVESSGLNQFDIVQPHCIRPNTHVSSCIMSGKPPRTHTFLRVRGYGSNSCRTHSPFDLGTENRNQSKNGCCAHPSAACMLLQVYWARCGS